MPIDLHGNSDVSLHQIVQAIVTVHTPDGFPVTAVVAAVIGAAVTLASLLIAVGLGRVLVAIRNQWSPALWG
jgi:hypothetical protein